MTRKITDLPLIKIREAKNPELFEKLSNPDKFHKLVCSNMEKILQKMISSYLTLVPERKAVYFYCDWFMLDLNHVNTCYSFREKIGESFPDEEFEKNCKKFCKEKVKRRQLHANHLTSHESRNPGENKWGGSATISFLMIPIIGDPFIIQIEGAPSGLKEWEDATLFLVTLRASGLIKFTDAQVSEILKRIRNSVKNNPEFLPAEQGIVDYANEAFAAFSY